MQLLFEYLTTEMEIAPEKTAQAMWRDYKRGGRHDKPEFLKAFIAGDSLIPPAATAGPTIPKRQARHAAALLRNPAD